MPDTHTIRPPPLAPGAPYVTCACGPLPKPHRGPAPARRCVRCGRIACALHAARAPSPGLRCVCDRCAEEA